MINHRTPQIIGRHQSIGPRYKSYIQVYTSGSCRRKGLQERPFIASGVRLPRATFYSRRARGVFPGSTKCSTYMCLAANPGEQETCPWITLHLLIFHGFATRLSGYYNYNISCLFRYHLNYQQDSVVGENPPSEHRGQLPTGNGTDRVRLARCECVMILQPLVPTARIFYAALSARYGGVRVMVSDN